jgi:hypothetical protein
VESFGGVAADDDPILMNAFEEHDAYLSAKEFKTTIIIGRKGSGKTAIFKKITDQSSYNMFSSGFTFRHYPWDHHNLQRQSGVSSEECYRESWIYFICLNAATLVVHDDASTAQISATHEQHSQLRSFLTDSFGSSRPQFNSIFSPQRRFKFGGRFGLPAIGFSADTVEAKDLPHFYSQINDFILDTVLRCMNSEHKYYLCFDELDFTFDPANPEYYNRLIGLIRAALYVNRRAKELGKKFSVIIFLRDDIYSTVNFEDKNKIQSPQYKNVSWVQGDYRGASDGEKNTLVGLMEKRFQVVFGTDAAIMWKDVFDEDQQMGGKQSKYKYMCDRTFLRPRDMIAFCNSTLNKYAARGVIKLKFANEDVLQGEQAYSEWLYKEIEDEIHKHFPDYKSALQCLRDLERLAFSGKNFDDSWVERQKNTRKLEYGSAHALEFLYNFSIIGFHQRGGAGGGTKLSWKYKDVAREFDRRATDFRVHPGFKKVLDLRQSRRTAL